ncbi:MAG: 6-phosphofructokinase, partial [Candidatus Obscuribacterales bacterium]|nr:6-phosphofructokinase [Candidatus Obscuribacterales bacterium]
TGKQAGRASVCRSCLEFLSKLRKPANCHVGGSSRQPRYTKARAGILLATIPYLSEAITMRIGILTGGGDCPGLNAVIRAVVKRSIKDFGSEVIGFLEGWRGPIENLVMPLTLQTTGGLIQRGGTILRTSRTNPFKVEGGPEKIMESMKKNNLDALIAVGGEDTTGVANKMFKQYGLNVVCVPKTIDNDLNATDYTFGFDTAVNIVCEALDRLHTTAESHNRVLVCEVMGRHAGWIACYGGIAGGADYICIPEKPVEIGEMLQVIKKRHARGRLFSIIVVAEGAKLADNEILKDQELDAFGHVKLGGIGDQIAKIIERETGYETRAMTLGHIQRGGAPSAFDRILGTRFGVRAADLVHEKKFGLMVALNGTRIVDVPIEAGVGQLKTLDEDMYKVAQVFFG